MSINVGAKKAEALFVSTLQPSDHPTADQVRDAIKREVREHGGVAGCAADMAAEFGRYPDVAAARMQWCLATVVAAETVRHANRLYVTPTVVLVFSPWLGWHTPGSAFGEPITRGLARRLADRGVTAVSLRIDGRCVDVTTAELTA